MPDAPPDDPQAWRRARRILGALLVLLVLQLVFGDHPWSDGVGKRLREGDPVRPVDLFVTYGFWLLLLDAAVLGAALWWLARWFDARPAPVRPELAPPSARPSRAGVAAVLLAMGASLALAAPRLDQSLWGDERRNVSRSILGGYERQGGELQYREVKWRDTFWYYRMPNNQVPHSVAVRAVHGVWSAVAQPETRLVNERVARIPAVLGGLASIGLLALLLWRFGYGRAGVLGAWLLALHPWHVRYLSEARGYSWLMALCSAMALALVGALHRGTWGRWAVYGGLQFLALWLYLAAVWYVVVLNVIAVGAIVLFWRGTAELRSQLTRWLAVSVAGGLAFLTVMIPNLIQLVAYMEENRGFQSLGADWLENAGSHFLAGAYWSYGKRGADPLFYELADVAPVLVWAFVALTLLALAGGALRLLRRGGVHAALAALLLLPAPLTWLQVWLRDDSAFYWYVIFALPGFVALVALGIAGLGGLASAPRARGAVVLAAGVAFLALHQSLAWPAHRAQQTRPVHPERESVELTRPTLDPFAPENAAIDTISWRDAPWYYDGLSVEIHGMKELRKFMRRSDRHGTPLYVNLARMKMAEEQHPDLTAYVRDPQVFELVARLPALDPYWNRYVYRYRGGATAAARR